MIPKKSLTYGQAGFMAHQFEAWIEKNNLQTNYGHAMLAYYNNRPMMFSADGQNLLKAAIKESNNQAPSKKNNNHVHRQLHYDQREGAVQARLKCALAVFAEAKSDIEQPWLLQNFERHTPHNFRVRPPSILQRLRDKRRKNEENLLGCELANEDKAYHKQVVYNMQSDDMALTYGCPLYFDKVIPLIKPKTP